MNFFPVSILLWLWSVRLLGAWKVTSQKFGDTSSLVSGHFWSLPHGLYQINWTAILEISIRYLGNRYLQISKVAFFILFQETKWDKGIGNLEKFGKIAELRNLKTNVCEKKKALLIEIAHGDSGFWEATFWLLPQGYCCSHPLGAWYGVWISIRSPRPGERKYKRAVQTLGLGCQGKALQHVIWLCKCSGISVSPEAPKLVSN